jgi:hypothetical protein
MISVITADIVKSRSVRATVWLPALKLILKKLGPRPKNWEVFRGDSFQLAINDPSQALITTIKIKAAMKSIGKVDIRMAIGIGDRTYTAAKITESNGSAFIYSGEKFELLKKEKQTLAIKSQWTEFDKEMNLYLKLGLIAMDGWTVNSAEVVKLALEYPNKSQEEIGRHIGIKQNAVSNRLKRAYYAELMEMNEMYKTKLEALL